MPRLASDPTNGIPASAIEATETPHKLENRLNQFEGVGLIEARHTPICTAPLKLCAKDLAYR